MPTAKPRITITLTEHQHSVLARLAVLQKTSMSSIVVDLVDTTIPVLERLADVLHNAERAPKEVLDGLRKSAQLAEDEAVQAGFKMGSLLEELLIASSGGASGEAAAPHDAPPQAEPPTSNRGVRISSPLPKIGSISPMKKGEKNGRAQK